MKTILGLNTIFHDSSACLVKDGELLIALEEERFTRSKHTRVFPHQAIARCLSDNHLTFQDITDIAVSVDSRKHLMEKLIYGLKLGTSATPFFKQEFLHHFRRNRDFWAWYRQTWGSDGPKVHFIGHHDSHIQGSFYVSPYENAALLSLDGSGEWSTHWMGEYQGNQFIKYAESFFPHSLGSFYETVTEFCGFYPNYDEGKTMGLAPFGDPKPFYDIVNRMIDIQADGQIKIDLSYFDYPAHGKHRFNQKFIDTFGKPRETSKTAPFAPHHENLAASFQKVLEDKVLEMCRILEKRSTAQHLVIAGGVSLNSVMNGRIMRETRFKDVYVMPAAGDSGTAIGTAFVVWNRVYGNHQRYLHNNPYLGTSYSNEHIEKILKTCKLNYVKSDDICADTARLLHEGNIIGWFQHRMEIGPRALGSRSILADPTPKDMKKKINAEVKYREPYRPFAPSANAGPHKTYFEISVDDPFMLKVDYVRPQWREKLAAITHVDGTARLQTVHADTHPLYHRMIQAFGKLSGVECVLNTSFNVMGEPVVESPEQAIRCFFTTGLDALVIGDFIVRK